MASILVYFQPIFYTVVNTTFPYCKYNYIIFKKESSIFPLLLIL